MRYLKGSCIYDLIACFPFSFIMRNDFYGGRLYKLAKLLRIPRLAGLLDIDNVKKIIKGYYNN